MKKSKLFFGLVILLCMMLGSLLFFNQWMDSRNNESKAGLTGHFDVSLQETIAYVTYEDGKPEIRLYDSANSMDSKIIELEDDKFILDPTFSNNGTTLIYIATNKDLEAELKSSVRQYDLESRVDRELFSVPFAITEIEFSPKGESLFYLQADVFQNYSPIASKRPHDYDVYEYKFSENQSIRHTNFKKYSMNSLKITGDGKSVFVQMLDDAHVETAEDSFNTIQRIFQIPLEQPTNLKVISDPNRQVDIFDFVFVPNENEIIYQSISNKDSGGIFQYELYKYNSETKEEQQLTHLKEYAANPKISAPYKIYFMVDRRFGEREAEYHLYVMNVDGTDVKKIKLGIQ